MDLRGCAKRRGGVQTDIKWRKRKILKMVCKVLLPALVSIVIWWLTYERISEIRGYYAIGGEALIPSVIWYILYKAYDFLS